VCVAGFIDRPLTARAPVPRFPALQQAGVRYTWDGEQSYGMLERSIPMEQIVRDN
jgi:hypothetical protein